MRLCVRMKSMRNNYYTLYLTVFVLGSQSIMTARAEQPLRAKVNALRAQSRFAAYAGWLDYLMHKSESYSSQNTSNALKECVRQLQNGQDPLESKRGYFEWAYLSKVDGRGQPFILGVPDTYDSSRSWPLEIYLHGFGADHKRQAPKTKSHPEPYFHLCPLGRTLGGGYSCLGEVDVLEAIDFVTRHWNIAPDQHHLIGASMGGYGVIKIASRHPHRFASVRPLAASGVGQPMGNMINLPVPAIHGGLDKIVPQVMIRAPLDHLRQIGGTATLYVDDERKHDARNSLQAMNDFRRIAMNHRGRFDVSRLQYAAVDEFARGAYWASIDEWGPEGRPATLNLQWTDGNTLFASLDNVTLASLDLTRAPIDRTQPLRVLFDGQLPVIHPAPLPDTVYLAPSQGPSTAHWSVLTKPPSRPDFRLHAPGGLRLLYSGEPLLIVYGTSATSERNQALRKAADLAAFSANGRWFRTTPQRDGLPIYQMPYGRHTVKADYEVTEQDLKHYNLLLIGGPCDNLLIKRLQKHLPVTLKETHIYSNDGESWPFEGAIFGLLHYNPLARQRLLYWVAADKIEDYAANTLGTVQSLMDIHACVTAAPDFLVLAESQTQVLAARRFDSRWRWEQGYADSPRFADSIPVVGPNAEILVHVLRKALGADFGLTRGRDWDSMKINARKSVTRLADVRALFYNEFAGRCSLTGKELLDLQRSLILARQSTKPLAPGHWRDIGMLVPAASTADINLAGQYQVVMPANAIVSLGRYTNLDTTKFALTERTLRQAWIQYAPAMIVSSKTVNKNPAP